MSQVRTRVSLGVAVVAVLASGTTTSGETATAVGSDERPARSADVHDVVPVNLSRGHAPRVMWVERGRIHRPGHRTVRVRGLGKDLGLYGRSRGSYIVSGYNWYPTDLYRVGPLGRATRFHTTPDTIGNQQVLAPKAGLLYTANGRGARLTSTFKRVDIRTGRVRRVLPRHEPATILNVSGRRAVLGGDPMAQSWTKKGKTRRIARGEAIYASIAANRFAIRKGSHTVMRRLDRPRRNLWRVENLYPRDISPDGSRLVSLNNLSGKITVSRMRTGRVTDRFRVDVFRSYLEPDSLQWESDRAFLVVYVDDNDHMTIVRCTLSGHCDRATGWGSVAGPSIDLIDQTPYLSYA